MRCISSSQQYDRAENGTALVISIPGLCYVTGFINTHRNPVQPEFSPPRGPPGLCFSFWRFGGKSGLIAR